jgi:hypothetical protein
MAKSDEQVFLEKDGSPYRVPVVHPKAVEAAKLIVHYFQTTTTIDKSDPKSRDALTELLTAARRVAQEVLNLETSLHQHARDVFSSPKPRKPPKSRRN